MIFCHKHVLLLRKWPHSRLQKQILFGCILIGIFVLLSSFTFLRMQSFGPSLISNTLAVQKIVRAASEPFPPTHKEAVIPRSNVEKRLFLKSFNDVVTLFHDDLTISNNETVFTSYAPPVDFGYWPRLSNGFIATLPFHSAVFLAGVYNGARLAQLPAFLNQRILDALVDGTTLSVTMKSEYSFHVLSGIFRTTVTSPLFILSQLAYCHRHIPNLFVLDISIKRPSSLAPRVAPSLTLIVQKTTALSPDLNKIEVGKVRGNSVYKDGTSSQAKAKHWYGQTKMAEWVDSAPDMKSSNLKNQAQGSFVSVHYDEMPHVLELKRGSSLNRWIFLASYGSTVQESLKAYQLGKEQVIQDILLDSHAVSWLETWKNGRVVVSGNSTLSSAALSAQYSLFSAIPSIDNENDSFERKFSGIPLCGLAPVNMSSCEYGLITTSQEYAMVPALMGLQPHLAQQVVMTRLSHLPTAVANAARVHSKLGAAFPWLTATSGLELHSNKHLASYNKVSSGLVAAAMAMVMPFVSAKDMLVQHTFADAAWEIAEFYISHMKPHRGDNTTSISIPHVVGPYDQSFIVNNSLSVNLLAKLSLTFANKIAPKKFETTNWHEIAHRLKLPVAKNWWNVWKVHDGFTYSTDARLSDFIFLRPEFTRENLSNKTLAKMLETYIPLYGDSSAFGLALFASNYLAAGDKYEATVLLDRILSQFTSTFYKTVAEDEHSQSTTPEKPASLPTKSSELNSDLKRNAAYWIWLCGPNVVDRSATNCLASAAAVPFTLVWGWLGFKTSPLPSSVNTVSPVNTIIASFRPSPSLPKGVSKIELLDWSLPSFGNGKSLSIAWNGCLLEVTLKMFSNDTKHKSLCKFACLVKNRLYTFSSRKAKAANTSRTISIMLVKGNSKQIPPVKVVCIP